jgi:hypothetical protein
MALGNAKLMYLPKDSWSARYDATFFTVGVEAVHLKSEAPAVPSIIGGKDNFPAYYYEVTIYQEHNKRSILRRYSHFKWLLDQVKADPPADEQPPDAAPIRMPPGTCPFQYQSEDFATNRKEQLSEFLADLLHRPGYATHPASLTFLELDGNTS